MLRLLNAETYKLRKSKSFITCTIATAAFVFLMYGMLLLADNIRSGNAENGTAGVIVTTNQTQTDGSPVSIWDDIQVMDLLQEVFSGDVIACILSIFASIFVISEFGSGMLKNIAGKGCSRSSIYLSKLLTTMLASVLIAASGIVSTLLAGRLFIGAHAFDGDFWKNLPIYTGLQLLMVAALTSLFVLIGEVSRNIAAGIAIGISVAAFPALLLNILDMQFAGGRMTPSQYWPITRMSGCPFEGFTAGYVTETLLVAAFWIILSAGLGIWHFCRTDIK